MASPPVATPVGSGLRVKGSTGGHAKVVTVAPCGRPAAGAYHGDHSGQTLAHAGPDCVVGPPGKTGQANKLCLGWWLFLWA